MATQDSDSRRKVADQLASFYQNYVAGRKAALTPTLRYPYDPKLCFLPLDGGPAGSGKFHKMQRGSVLAGTIPLEEHQDVLHRKYVLSAWLSMLSKREQVISSALRVPPALYLGPTVPGRPGSDLWPVFHFKRVVASDWDPDTNAFWILVGEFTNATPRTVYARVLYWGDGQPSAVGTAVAKWFKTSPENDVQGTPKPDDPSAPVDMHTDQTTQLENKADIQFGRLGIVDRMGSFAALLLQATEITSYWDLGLREVTTVAQILEPKDGPRLADGQQWYSAIAAMSYMPYWRLSKNKANPQLGSIPLLQKDADAIWFSARNLRLVTQGLVGVGVSFPRSPPKDPNPEQVPVKPALPEVQGSPDGRQLGDIAFVTGLIDDFSTRTYDVVVPNVQRLAFKLDPEDPSRAPPPRQNPFKNGRGTAIFVGGYMAVTVARVDEINWSIVPRMERALVPIFELVNDLFYTRGEVSPERTRVLATRYTAVAALTAFQYDRNSPRAAFPPPLYWDANYLDRNLLLARGLQYPWSKPAEASRRFSNIPTRRYHWISASWALVVKANLDGMISSDLLTMDGEGGLLAERQMKPALEVKTWTDERILWDLAHRPALFLIELVSTGAWDRNLQIHGEPNHSSWKKHQTWFWDQTAWYFDLWKRTMYFAPLDDILIVRNQKWTQARDGMSIYYGWERIQRLITTIQVKVGDDPLDPPFVQYVNSLAGLADIFHLMDLMETHAKVWIIVEAVLYDRSVDIGTGAVGARSLFSAAERDSAGSNGREVRFKISPDRAVRDNPFERASESNAIQKLARRLRAAKMDELWVGNEREVSQHTYAAAPVMRTIRSKFDELYERVTNSVQGRPAAGFEQQPIDRQQQGDQETNWLQDTELDVWKD